MQFFFKKIILLFIGCFSFYLMLSLATFYPFDDTYFQFTGNGYFCNLLGKWGAFFSDILFFIFGIVAYFIPCVIFFVFWNLYFKKRLLNFFNLSFTIIGIILLLFSFCGLAESFLDDFYYCHSGGIIGSLLYIKVLYIFNENIIDVVFLCTLMLGVVLLKDGNKKIFSCIRSFLIIKSIYINIFQKIFYFFKKMICNSYVYNFFFNKCFNINNHYIFRLKYILLNISKCKNIFFNKNRIKKLYNSIFKIYFNCFKTNHRLSRNNIRNKQLTNNNVLMLKQDKQYKLNNNKILFVKSKKMSMEVEYLFPDINLLQVPQSLEKFGNNIEFLEIQSKLIESTLANYNIQARVVNILQGPVITRFELNLAPGLKSSRISNLSLDLARSLSISYLKVVKIIPGKSYIGLEIMNKNRENVYLREILDTEKFKLSCEFLTLGIGKDISGDPVIINLSEMPHLLIAGTTGSGKSIGINSMIISILYKATPENVRFIMIDPKILELSVYNGIPHLLTKVLTSIEDIINMLNWCVEEMERRYKIMADCGVRNLKSYHNKIKSNNISQFSMYSSLSIYNNTKDESFNSITTSMPYIVIIIDEFADLILSTNGKQIESLIIRLSQKARACGMHLILATQRPSVNVITGLIKANIPSRIAFTVSSNIDSRTILDQSGAELLLGRGDMLYLSSCSFVPIRVHGAFVCDEEISLVVNHWKKFIN